MSSPRTTGAVVRRLDSILTSPWFPLYLALLAAVIALLSSWFVYPNFSWNRDEPVYLWQASLLADGQLTTSDGGYPSLFHPWLSGHRDGVFFSQYPLGWPLAILAGETIGSPVLTLVFACVLAVLGAHLLAHEITGDKRVAGLAAGLFLASPIVAVQSGVFLTYLYAAGFGTFFAACFLRSLRTGSRLRMALAGALLGMVLITRTYDAVIWAVVMGGWALATEHRSWRRHLRLVAPLLLGVVPFLAFQLWHNVHLSGHPLEFPITVADPLDRFGFGWRRLMPDQSPVYYGPSSAVRSTAKHVFFLPWFLFGAYVGIALAVHAVIRGARSSRTWLLVAIGMAFPVLYLPFWGTYLSSLTSRVSGPIYYIPAFIPLCILAAMGLIDLVRIRPKVAAAAVLAALALTVPIGLGRVTLNRHLSRIQEPWETTTDSIDGPAVVIVSPKTLGMFLNPYGRNAPDLDGDLLWTTHADASLFDLLDEHPDRNVVVQRPLASTIDLAPSENTGSFEVEVIPAQVISAAAVDVEVTVTAAHEGVLAMGVSTGDDVAWLERSIPVTRGDLVSEIWTLSAEGEGASGSADGAVSVPASGALLEVWVGYGPDASTAQEEPSLRYQILVRGDGEVEVLMPGAVRRLLPVDPDDPKADELDPVWVDGLDHGEIAVSVLARTGP